MGTIVWDPSTDELTWSAEACSILHVLPAETTAIQAFLDRFHPDDVDGVKAAIAPSAKNRRQRARVTHADGSLRIVDVQTCPLPDTEDERLVIALTDMTAIVAATRRAEQNEDLILRSQAASKIGTFRWNPDTDVGEWSPEMYRILGYEETVIPCAQAFFARVHPDDTSKFAGAMQTALNRDVKAVEGRLLRPDGTIVHVLINGIAIEDPQGHVELLGTAIDLSDRRELEQQLSQAQKMEAVGTLAGGLAHDFNNYLSVVVNNLPVLREQLAAGSEALDALADIERASERCRVLTQRLLAFGRKQPHRPRDVDVCWLVASLQGMLDRLVGDHISVETKTPTTPLCAHIDPNQLEQVVVNLVVNARDAMRTGGKVTIFVDAALVDEEHAQRHGRLTPGDYVKLFVSDTGVGIPEGVKARVFEPFFTTKEDGTGLGLSTVHGIIEQNGGTVMLQPSEAGTTFVVCIPRCFPDAVPASPRGLAPEPAGANEVVLLVEDQPEVRRAARRTLRRHGYVVVDAASAEEALEAWHERRGRVDLVLSDVQLPGMSGVELLEALHQLQPGLPALLMTGYAPEEVLRAAPGTLSAILQKPVGVVELLAAIRVALGDAQE